MSNPRFPGSHYSIQFANRLVVWYNIHTALTCVTLGTPLRSIEQNGAVICNIGYLAHSGNTNKYVLKIRISVLLIL